MSVPCMHWQSVGNYNPTCTCTCTCDIIIDTAWTLPFLLSHIDSTATATLVSSPDTPSTLQEEIIRGYLEETTATLNVWFVHYLVRVFLFLVLCPFLYRVQLYTLHLSLYMTSLFTVCAVYCMHTKMMLFPPVGPLCKSVACINFRWPEAAAEGVYKKWCEVQQLMLTNNRQALFTLAL